jgi:hypothetical protein
MGRMKDSLFGDEPYDPNDDITRNYHGGHPLSEIANQTTNKSRDALRIIRYVATCGARGSTSDQCEEAIGMQHQTCSARFSDLKKAGVLLLNGERRQTRRGRSPAGVCVLSQLGLRILARTQ